jgi:hypothetical protein
MLRNVESTRPLVGSTFGGRVREKIPGQLKLALSYEAVPIAPWWCCKSSFPPPSSFLSSYDDIWSYQAVLPYKARFGVLITRRYQAPLGSLLFWHHCEAMLLECSWFFNRILWKEFHVCTRRASLACLQHVCLLTAFSWTRLAILFGCLLVLCVW